MGYPERGVVLDRFRGIVPDAVLREVQAIELAPGQRLDMFEWVEVLMDVAKRHKLIGENHGPKKVHPVDVSGQPTVHRGPRQK